MILKRIFTNPDIFDVHFTNGVNYIYGEKKADSSINGIGKSLFIDFIDFCLLSHYERSTSSRLRSAYDAGLLSHTTVTLEFTINSQPGHISRSFATPREATLNWNGKSTTHNVNDLRNILGELLFSPANYSGVFDPEWFRRLISFYIKIQKHSEEKFFNPLKYSKDLTVHELPVYLLYHLRINNTLPFNYSILAKTKSSIEDSIKTITSFIESAYGVKDLGEVRKRIENINKDISDINDNIKKLYLLRNYDKFEAEADKLTVEIKQLYYENASDKRTIDEYNSSLNNDTGFSSANIERIYNDISEGLGVKIRKSLDEAIAFRKNLSASRKQFIQEAITEITQTISKREQVIGDKDQQRQQLLISLYSKTAYSDLASAYKSLSDFQSQKEELISQTRTLNDLSSEVRTLSIDQQELLTKLPSYLSDIASAIDEFNNVVSEIFQFVYPEEKDDFLTVTPGKKNSLLNLKFWERVKQSHGKNIGRTLIFDLAVLFNNIYKNYNAPRFLIHDGIFDSLDRAHLIKTYEFIQNKVNEGFEFQYITTINEGGFLGKNFISSDLVNPDRMKKEAIITLSPLRKLLKSDFYAS